MRVGGMRAFVRACVCDFHHCNTTCNTHARSHTYRHQVRMPANLRSTLDQGSGVCERRGGRTGLPVPNSPYGLCERKATFESEDVNDKSALRSCVKVEVKVLGSPSLIVHTVSVDVQQQPNEKENRKSLSIIVLEIRHFENICQNACFHLLLK